MCRGGEQTGGIHDGESSLIVVTSVTLESARSMSAIRAVQYDDGVGGVIESAMALTI